MAKGIKSKDKSRFLSKHSRAARRAVSPSINTDKSLKDVQLPVESDRMRGVRPGAGITKRKAKSKQATRAQKTRQEKTLARAEVVVNQLEQKKESSLKRGKKIKNRGVAWEDVNDRAGDKARGRKASEMDGDHKNWADAENIAMGGANSSGATGQDMGQDTSIGHAEPTGNAAAVEADDSPEVW